MSLTGIAEQAAEALTNVDGRIFRTFKTLMLQPGVLTVAYTRGQRRAFVAPLQVFLVANILFFLLQSVAGMHILDTPLSSHMQFQTYSSIASPLVDARVASLNTTVERYRPLFDRAQVVNAKTLIVALVPLFALLGMAAFRGSRQPTAAHVVFALHFFAFLLLLICLLIPVILLMGVVMEASGLRGWKALDRTASTMIMIACALYLYRAIGVTYPSTRLARAIKAGLLAASVAPLFVFYRLFVFLVTLYTTSP